MTFGLEGRKVRELRERRGIPQKEGKFNSIRCSSTLQVLDLVSSIAMIAFLCIPAVSFPEGTCLDPKVGESEGKTGNDEGICSLDVLTMFGHGLCAGINSFKASRPQSNTVGCPQGRS